MILQLLRQFNNLNRSKTIACSASFCFGLSLRFPCPLPKESLQEYSRNPCLFRKITQNHNREYEHAQWKKSPYFGPRWHWACSKSNFTRSPFRMTVGDLGTSLFQALTALNMQNLTRFGCFHESVRVLEPCQSKGSPAFLGPKLHT